MKKKIALLAAMGVMAAGTAYGAAFRIPEQSINAVALSNAYIAHTEGADTSYYNPANMSWQEDRWQIEVSASYINLPSIDYTDANDSSRDGSSKTENIVIPMFHAVSPDFNNLRFGFSFVVPFGLSKRWNDDYPSNFSEDFTLNVFEANPTFSYKFCDNFSIGGGLRIMHTNNNTVKTSGDDALTIGGNPVLITRDMDGDATELGYNLAMTYKPTKDWALAATYRSRVTMGLSGDAEINYSIYGTPIAAPYDGSVKLDIATPAILTLSTAYTFDKTTVELTWDRSYWSKLNKLEFVFDGTTPDLLLDKDWNNSDAYRIGITHKCTDKFTAMLGFGYDETPIPDKNLGFELPDSNALLYSIGGRYKMNDKLELGGAYLYDYKKTRKISADDGNARIVGKFENAGAHVLTLGAIYKF